MTIGSMIKAYLRPAKSAVVPCLRTAGDLACFGKGYCSHLLRGTHDRAAFLALRRLFCATNGRLNDLLAYCHSATHRPYAVDARTSLLPGMDQKEVARAVQCLDHDGYYVFEQRLPEEACQRLTELALNAPCTGVDQNVQTIELEQFDSARSSGVRFDLRQQDIMENPTGQRIASDPGLLAVAQAYFRAKAVQDLVAMWWSLPSSNPNSKAAQLYHFDMDRVKFLKFFVYLTDVDEKNGPHCFIAGSHRRLPKALRQDKRHTDEEVFAHYPPEQRIEIKGPRGTLCAVDTRGLHKGKKLVEGRRLIFQVEFAINLFGMYYPPVLLNDRFSLQFLSAIEQRPYTYANYVMPNAKTTAGRDSAFVQAGVGM